MMKLDEFKEEIYKCSGCGICQNVCPIYKLLRVEPAVSRGKFNLLNAIVNRNLKLSKKTADIMDLCTHCGACSEFCPSNIDAQKIVETANYDLINNGIFKYRKFLASKLLMSKLMMTLVKTSLNMARKYNILDKFEFLNKKLFHSKNLQTVFDFLKVKIQPDLQNNNTEKSLKIAYFQGCINKYINPSCANSVRNILSKTTTEIIYDDFDCCALPLKSMGDFDGFKKIAKKNLDKIPADADYIVFDCASCYATVLEYEKFLDGEDLIKFQSFKDKFISIYEFLDKINFIPEKKDTQRTFTYHSPCHTRFNSMSNYAKEVASKSENTEFISLQDENVCCGTSGTFCIINPDISQKINIQKAKNILNTNAQYVLTTCPMCEFGIRNGLNELCLDNKFNKANNTPKTMQIIEFLAE